MTEQAAQTLWTAQELADFLQVSRRKVFSDLSRAGIPCIRFANPDPLSALGTSTSAWSGGAPPPGSSGSAKRPSA